MNRAVSLLGIGVIVGLAWLMSNDRARVRWRPVFWGVGLQFTFALLVFGTGAEEALFHYVGSGVRKLISFAEVGADFVFQTVEPHQITLGFGEGSTETFIQRISPPVKTFAFWVLPTIIFFSSLMSILYYLGVMQVLVRAVGKIMQKTMGTSGAESMSVASNIFVGQTEAPLVVKPFVENMTRSELHAVMTGGFATVAGGVFAVYVLFLEKGIPDIAGHLVVASVLSAPAALALAKVMYPEDGEPETAAGAAPAQEKTAVNVIEAASMGATQGLTLALNVAAMLIAFIGLVHMGDWMLGLVPVRFCEDGVTLGWHGGCSPLTLTGILGTLFAPLAWCMGVPWEEAPIVGALLGEKLVFTELVAYQHLGQMLESGTPVLSQRSAIIASYALCGFANFASIGIQIGGIGGIAPSRYPDLAAVALRAMVAGMLAAMMTATVAGVLVG